MLCVVVIALFSIEKGGDHVPMCSYFQWPKNFLSTNIGAKK